MSEIESKLEKARALRQNNVSYFRIVAATGLSLYTLKCELEPGYREKITGIVMRSRANRRKGRAKPEHREANVARRYFEPTNHVETSVSIPERVLAERERRLAMEPRSLTAALMGDPPSPDWHKRTA